MGGRGADLPYRFDEFTLDPDGRWLRRSGVEVGLQPKVFDLLTLLVELRPRVASSRELQSLLWPDTAVSTDALLRLVKEARRALGDDGASQKFIRTIRGRGYAFVADAVLEPYVGPMGVVPAAHQGTAGYPHQLDEQVASVLRFAAAVGTEFSPDLVALAAPSPAREVHAALFEAEREGLVRRRPKGLWAFDDGQVHQALYRSVQAKPRERALTHLAIGKALEADDRANPSAAELASHFEQAAAAGGAAKSISYFAKAAEQASARLAHENATAFLERALSLLRFVSPAVGSLHPELLLRLGQARANSHGIDAARATYLEAAHAARQAGLPRLVALAALGYADRQASRDDDAVSMLEDALAYVEAQSPDAPVVIVVKARLASALRHRDAQQAYDLIDAAVADARRSSDPWVLAHTLEDRARVGLGADDTRAWIELNRQVSTAAREAGELELELHGTHGVLSGHLEVGEADVVRQEIPVLEEFAYRLRTPLARGVLLLVRTMLALLEGRFDAARTGIQILNEEVDASRHPDLVIQLRAQIFLLMKEEGNISVLAPALREFSHRHPEMVGIRAALLAIRAMEQAEPGLVVELRTLVRGLDDLSRDRQWLFTHVLVAETAAALTATDLAADLYRRLKPYSGLVVVMGYCGLCYGAVDYFLGLLARCRGDLTLAERHQRRALALHERLLAAPFLARSELALAELLSEAGGDEGEIRERATRAVEAARSLGMPQLRDAAARLLAEHDDDTRRGTD